MNILALIQKRYTAKKYNAHKVVPQEKIEELKEILRRIIQLVNLLVQFFDLFVVDQCFHLSNGNRVKLN